MFLLRYITRRSVFFFFQAEDGIRDLTVTGVQTCALPILNGPNLYLLGEREPELYGRITLVEIEARTREQARALGVQVSWTQTNHEGELVDAIQRLKGKADGLMINAAAFKIGRASCRERV